MFGGVSSHRPTSIPTVCYVLFSAALIAPAAMLLLLLAEAFETAVDAVPLAEEIEDDASDGLEAALERRGGMQTVWSPSAGRRRLLLRRRRVGSRRPAGRACGAPIRPRRPPCQSTATTATPRVLTN